MSEGLRTSLYQPSVSSLNQEGVQEDLAIGVEDQTNVNSGTARPSVVKSQALMGNAQKGRKPFPE